MIIYGNVFDRKLRTLGDDMAKNDSQRITSCTITWENSDDILSVITRVLPKEIQVRFYSGGDLMFGKIWPLSEQQKQNLFSVLYKCLDDWDRDDYTADMPDSPHWQFKICTKESCLRTVVGAEEPPPHGREIKEIIAGIIGEDNFYFFDRKNRIC